MFVRPVGGKKDSRPDDKALKMALRRNRPHLSEGEIGERRRIPGRVVVCCHSNSLAEPPRGSNVEAVRAEIPSYVRPPATDLQALLPSCGLRQHERRDESQREQDRTQLGDERQ